MGDYAFLAAQPRRLAERSIVPSPPTSLTPSPHLAISRRLDILRAVVAHPLHAPVLQAPAVLPHARAQVHDAGVVAERVRQESAQRLIEVGIVPRVGAAQIDAEATGGSCRQRCMCGGQLLQGQLPYSRGSYSSGSHT